MQKKGETARLSNSNFSITVKPKTVKNWTQPLVDFKSDRGEEEGGTEGGRKKGEEERGKKRNLSVILKKPGSLN